MTTLLRTLTTEYTAVLHYCFQRFSRDEPAFHSVAVDCSYADSELSIRLRAASKQVASIPNSETVDDGDFVGIQIVGQHQIVDDGLVVDR